MEKIIIKRIRGVFALLLATTILATGAFAAFIPATTNSMNTNTRYTLEIASVALVIFVVPLAIKAFDLQRRTVGTERESALKRYYRISVTRLLALTATIIINLALYHILQADSPLYCALISAVAMIYCFPTQGNLTTYIEDVNETTQQTAKK